MSVPLLIMMILIIIIKKKVIMGCTHQINSVMPIPAPQGPPIDPLNSQDIVGAITCDPHIHYFQKKIQEVMNPIIRKRKQAQNDPNFENNSAIEKAYEKKKAKGPTSGYHNPNQITIQSFATTDRKEHQKYVQSVNNALTGNDASVTNIMGYMIEEMADIRQGKKAEGMFGNSSYAALKCFIYLYTGHYTYKKVNSQLRRSEYDKISTVIAVVKKQLEQYNKQKFARKLKANQKHGQFLNLYRGIPKPDKTMMKGSKLYWKGFTSTSLDSVVANRFGRYVFVLNLDKASPHAYMVVPEELSQFKEEQIILFPYFYFECSNVQNFTSGARYQCKQSVCPDE